MRSLTQLRSVVIVLALVVGAAGVSAGTAAAATSQEYCDGLMRQVDQWYNIANLVPPLSSYATGQMAQTYSEYQQLGCR